MKLFQLAKGYRYNTDSMLLADFVFKQLDKHKLFNGSYFKALDIGAGCGVLAFMLARYLFLKSKRPFSIQSMQDLNTAARSRFLVDAIDKQKCNYELMQNNNFINSFKIRPKLVELSEFIPAYKYNLAICNPPFYSKLSSDNEHISISRQAANLPPNNIFTACARLLAANAALYMCYGASDLARLLSAAKEAKFYPEVLRLVHAKSDKSANLALIKFVRSAKRDLCIMPPLICFKQAQPSEQLQSIYLSSKLESLDFKVDE